MGRGMIYLSVGQWILTDADLIFDIKLYIGNGSFSVECILMDFNVACYSFIDKVFRLIKV